MYWLEWSKEIKNNFRSAVPWYICCSGLEQKACYSAHRESLCYCFLTKQGLNFHSLSSCEDHSLPLSWYTANFSASMAACSLLREEKELFFFEKSGMSHNRCPSKEVQLHIFFHGFRKKSRSLFYWALSTSSLEASQFTGVCERDNTIADEDSPHLSSFRIWISNSNLQSHSTSLQD